MFVKKIKLITGETSYFSGYDVCASDWRIWSTINNATNILQHASAEGIVRYLDYRRDPKAELVKYQIVE